MEDAPWYREYWWIWLIVFLLVVGGIIAIFALRGNDDAEQQTVTETQTVAETPTVATEPETIQMPDFVGTPYPDAVEQALGAGLFPNSFTAESAEERGTVIDQDPGAGAPVALGATIRIDVSRGQGLEEERQAPDLTGLELPDALRACAQAGFTCRVVPAAGPGLVVTAERPVPGGSTGLAQIELSVG